MTSSKFNDRHKKLSSKSLNGVAYDLQQSTRQQLPKWLAVKRNFLSRSVVYEKATSSKPYAQVGLAERAHPKIMLMEKGGTLRPKQSPNIAIPANNTKARPRTLLNRKYVFIGIVKNLKAIWKEVRGGALQLLYVLKPETKYSFPSLFVDTGL